MKSFNEFLSNGTIKKQTPNKERSKSLILEADKKRQFLEIALKNIPEENMNYNFVVDNCYDILIELIRAKMFLEGYKSDNSHEAEISYMVILGFPITEIRFMDELRYNRNGIKYYGNIFNKEYALKVINFMERLYPKLKSLI
ncbi:MAG TPA: hypothetical protein VJJ23_00585 [Candidatus Nanoarchaeia archaeon]|nr:hypothetical protein [Candidatus Nanoarchaeia archaeon]